MRAYLWKLIARTAEPGVMRTTMKAIRGVPILGMACALVLIWSQAVCQVAGRHENYKGKIEFDGQIGRFYDEAGKVVREISFADPPQEVKDSSGKLVQRNQRLQVSASKASAIFIASIGAASSIELLDSNGTQRWRKELRENNEVFESALSQDGEIVTYVEGCNMGCDRSSAETRTRLHAVGKNGVTLLTYSGSQACRLSTSAHDLSPDGRFAFIRCNPHGLNTTRTAVLDIREKRFWNSNELFAVFEFKEGNRIKVRRTSVQIENGKSVRGSSWAEINLDSVEWKPIEI